MSIPLYRQTFIELQTTHSILFAEFLTIHNQYRVEQQKWQNEFDRLGKEVLKVITEAENRLCSKMENSRRSKFSNHLSERFWAEIRSTYPLIDLVGVTIT